MGCCVSKTKIVISISPCELAKQKKHDILYRFLYLLDRKTKKEIYDEYLEHVKITLYISLYHIGKQKFVEDIYLWKDAIDKLDEYVDCRIVERVKQELYELLDSML